MEHHFDVEIASKYGLTEAILLNNIYFWLQHNQANEKNFYDGYYWTYNSIKTFTMLFPYLTEKKIRNALSNLENSGLIKTGNYNRSSYDRTKWYTLTELGTSILTKRQIEICQKANENNQKVEPIPYINTYIKTDNKNILDETFVSSNYSNKKEPILENSLVDGSPCLDELPYTPQTPLSPSSHNLLDKIEKKPRKRQTKEERISNWVDNNIQKCEIYDFSDEVEDCLEKYFNYLANFGTLFPWTSIEMQLNKLNSIPSNKQVEVINKTIERGWKSLIYVIDEKSKSENSPSYRIQNSPSYTKEERQAWADKYKNTGV